MGKYTDPFDTFLDTFIADFFLYTTFHNFHFPTRLNVHSRAGVIAHLMYVLIMYEINCVLVQTIFFIVRTMRVWNALYENSII